MENIEDIKCLTLGDSETNKIYWDKFYRTVKIQEESAFCRFIKSYKKKDYLILDIGCGSGRDTFSFAKDGYEVVGIDRSAEAIQYNNAIKRKMGNIGNHIQFNLVDINFKEEFEKIIENVCRKAENQDLSVMAYLRFFIHAIDEKGEKIVLSTLSAHLKKGDYLAAEFRTNENEYQKKVFENHYRRYIDAERFLKDLECKYQFKKEFFQKGTGLAVYNEEDPNVCRILAKKI